MIKKEEEFKKWLALNGAETEGGRRTRISALRRIQKVLPELGMLYNSLDEAWEADRFEALLECLQKMRDNALDGGQDYRILLPRAEIGPEKQVYNRIHYLRQYKQFLTETTSGQVTQADRRRQKNSDTATSEERGATNAEIKKEQSPMNLILYGPPGTGKTYATAKEAVRLCGEQPPEDRAELMAIYQRLVEDGRIVFVTFHQSMSYEDFVEGLRPTTKPEKNENGGKDRNEETASAGFRLEPFSGVFKRIAKKAEDRQGNPSVNEALKREGRRFFKMSIGANNKREAPLFEEAINDKCAILGFCSTDLKDSEFDSEGAILKASEKAKDDNPKHAAKMLHRFRNEVEKHDIVIVGKGQKKFRAIGEFIGDYKFHLRPKDDEFFGEYAHRRAVRWLWVEPDGVPVKGNIYDRQFNEKTIYLLDDKLNIPVLERYINSQRADSENEPEPFVLIIDEINRANISKVFGELITLLEPDKRLGQDNELKVLLPYSRDEFGVPPNLHILGTMNTADRSIALLDVALRRRFEFREMMPKAKLLAGMEEECDINLQRLLEIINERIEYLYDREHQIGHAYFMKCDSKKAVDKVMRRKVIPLLAEYFFEDWGKIAAVLGDAVSEDAKPPDGEKEIKGGFLNCSILEAPQGFGDGNAPSKFSWRLRSEDEGFTYDKLLANK